MQKKQILVTSALPYANGPIHIGHMVEHIQSDIWVRFQRMLGHTCHFVCADDVHGTPIMLRALREKTDPESFIAATQAEHNADFVDFGVVYDNYSSTHSPHNRQLVYEIWEALKAADAVAEKSIEQFYDPDQGMFLPDRFIKGTCPKCKSPDQHGDSCEVCSSTYSPEDLIDPVSAVTGATPVKRETTHLFVRLAPFQEMLEQWVGGSAVQSEVANKLKDWFEEGLRDWDVTRDEPYFGFEIPGHPGKYFYVWVDAPVGYMASFKELCEREGIDFDAFWKSESTAEVYHFIGKDIVYFHTLFWPTMLSAAGFRKPSGVFVHGFLTVDGQKMSKSRGTFITARTYLEHLTPDYLRYYYAGKLGSGLSDLDLNLEDFVNRINSDMVGKVVNIASRCAGFIHKQFGGRLSSQLHDEALYQQFVDESQTVAQHFHAREYSRAVRAIMALADEANRYIDERKPWVMIKDPDRHPEVQEVCTQGINLFRVLMTFLKPVVPFTAAQAETFLNAGQLCWDSPEQPLLAHEVAPFVPLMTRVDPKAVRAMIESSKKSEAKPAAPAPVEPVSDEIDFATFSKVDMRVGKVIAAAAVEGADRLLQLTIDLGNGDHRNVISGIRASYDPDSLVDRLVVVVANLAPRKMKFGVSEAMVLTAGEGEKVHLLAPDEGARPGQVIQ